MDAAHTVRMRVDREISVLALANLVLVPFQVLVVVSVPRVVDLVVDLFPVEASMVDLALLLATSAVDQTTLLETVCPHLVLLIL